MSNTWYLPREDDRWVGPIEVSVTNDFGVPIEDAAVTFAIAPHRARPAETDYTDPVPSEDDPSKVGVTAVPVTNDGIYGIYAKAVRADQTIVLEPIRVGWIVRT